MKGGTMQGFYSSAADARGAAVLAVLAFLALAFFLRRRAALWLSHVRRKPLMTANEIEFFGRLKRALPGYEVFPQVAFAALLTDDGKSFSPQARWNVRARFDRKIADYVICDRRSLQVVALVELDDRSHTASADRQRDAITQAAGYTTFRFPSKRKPSEGEIAALFEHARAWVIHPGKTPSLPSRS